MAQVGVKVIIVPVEGRFQEARLMDMNHDLTLTGWAPTVTTGQLLPAAAELCGDQLADQLRPLV
jgi:hypothetical protein